jgi:hypothetical protein
MVRARKRPEPSQLAMPKTSAEVLERVDLKLLDKQIGTLAVLCDHKHIEEQLREDAEGVFNFLVDLYNAMMAEQQ